MLTGASKSTRPWVRRDFLVGRLGRQAIIRFSILKNPLEGERPLTFIMLDADIVAVSPSNVWQARSTREYDGGITNTFKKAIQVSLQRLATMGFLRHERKNDRRVAYERQTDQTTHFSRLLSAAEAHPYHWFHRKP